VTGRTGSRVGFGSSITRVGLALSIAFGAIAAGAGYWQVFRAADLSRAPDNPAVIAAARNVVRGRILDLHEVLDREAAHLRGECTPKGTHGYGCAAVALASSNPNSRCWTLAGNGSTAPELKRVTRAVPATKPRMSV